MDPFESVERPKVYRLGASDALNRVNTSTKKMVQHVVSLAELYIKDGTLAYGRQLSLGVVGVWLSAVGWVLFVATTIFAVSPKIIPYWESFGIWSLVHLSVGSFLVQKMRKAFKDQSEIEGFSISEKNETRDIVEEIRIRGMVP